MLGISITVSTAATTAINASTIVVLACVPFAPTSPYRFTYVDEVDGSIQVRDALFCRTKVYNLSTLALLCAPACCQLASAIPPLYPCLNTSAGTGTPCGVLFTTHGAGVDPGSPTWSGAYQV